MQCYKGGRKARMGAMAAACLAFVPTLLSAQTFDTPVSDFQLESSQEFVDPNQLNIQLPITTNVGNFDLSVLGPNDALLNEVAVVGSSISSNPNGSEYIHRMWTIVHDSSTDTRSLVSTTPSDILTAEQQYQFPDSLQLLDLNQDGRDDLAFMGGIQVRAGSAGKFLSPSQGGTRGDVFGVPAQNGPSFFASSLNVLGGQTDGGFPGVLGTTQPVLAAADFDGDGQVDLAFYDFEVPEAAGIGAQIAVSLENNGGFGTLPRTQTLLNLPAEISGIDAAFNALAADIDSDGIPDLAITFGQFTGGENFLLVFKGNGDGTFVPDPIATADLGADFLPNSSTVGNFDGDEFLDFAVIRLVDDNSDISLVFCSPGSPAICSIEVLDTPDELGAYNITSGDFDGDGLDDLATAFVEAPEIGGTGSTFVGLRAGVDVRLNQGGSFPENPDQSLPLGGDFDNRIVFQVVAKEIDGCGGPDLAYIGVEADIPTPTPALVAGGTGPIDNPFTNFASVAFNHNDDPVADAGTPVSVSGGFQVGGEPTCSGELGETLNIQWEVLSGAAEFSDPTAANPTVASTGTSVLQVTCSDLCGAATSATVTVQGNGGFLLNGTGCSLGQAAAGGMGWLLGLVGFLPLAIRRIRG